MTTTRIAVPEGADPTIFFDVTELVVMDLRTGIQRVVRELLEHGQAGAARGTIVPVIAAGSRFHSLSEAGWARVRSPGAGVAEKRIAHQRGVPRHVRLIKRAANINPALYNMLQRVYFSTVLRRRSNGLYDPDPVLVKPGDKLVLADSFWGGAPTLKAVSRAVSGGARANLVAYDLIPLTHPQFCDARLVEKFLPLMRRAIALSERVLAISEDCARAFRAQFPGANVIPIRLGHDIREDNVPAQAGAGRSEAMWPEALWTGDSRVFVIVGSIEPRKGHAVVLEAFERRWARGEPDKLLILGKVGWQVDDLIVRIEQHAEAGRRLFAVHNATDAMLRNALQRAHAGIIASYIEGFGLPLAEGLSAGLPMVASDIPVFHEIAGDKAVYFAPGNAAALDEAVDLLHRRYAEMTRAAGEFTWPDWRTAAAEFFATVEGHVASTSD